MFIVSEPAPPRHRSLLKTPVSIARDALDFRKLIRAGETVGWAEATAEPLLLTRLLDAQGGTLLTVPRVLIRRFGPGAPLPQLWDGVRPMYRARPAAASAGGM